MPKITSYTAPWLAQGVGQRLFSPASESTSSFTAKKKPVPGPRRRVARRGTEVFVAVGKELRWGDLAYIKEQWVSKPSSWRSSSRIKREDSEQPFSNGEGDVLSSKEDGTTAHGFRAIKTPVADEIRQLVMSPNEDYLAILTAHTVHICVLPDPSHLTSEDTGPLKPKIWTLGPTTHVTSRSPVATGLWHPLGVNGSCLVTITTDAIVRLWELSLENRWSFDTPTLSIDLKKLADGMTLDQDFTASTMATNTNFSPDSFEMEVASASFAVRGSGGWSPMTLWVAMTEGDVYALCPLLPQRWAPPPTLIPSLSVSIVSNFAALEDDSAASERAKLLARQQLEWMGEIDNQEPQIVDLGIAKPPMEIYNRPSKPGVIPRLQGPFELLADPEGDDLDSQLTDIHVIGKKLDSDELMTGEDLDLDFDEREQEGLSLSVVCLLSSSGQMRVLLDLEGVEAQWLPPRNKINAKLHTPTDSASLLTFQSIDTMTPTEVTEGAWPMFSSDAMSRYAVFVTSHAGITYASLTPWVFRLEAELGGDSEAGSDFRLGLLANGHFSTRERLFTQPAADVDVPLTAASVMRDPDLGYFLLSGTPYEPIPLTFDSPEEENLAPIREESYLRDEKPSVMEPLDFYEPRPAFQPSHTFDEPSGLPELLGKLRSSRYRALLGQEIRLSPVTLQVFTDAHRILGEDSHKLGMAVAELFRRCHSLQYELVEQIKKANEVKDKIDRITGKDKTDGGESDDAQFERRIARAEERQQRLGERLEAMRKHAGKAATRQLSTKEMALVEEVKNLEASLLGGSPGKAASGRQQQKNQLSRRLEEVRRLRDELQAEVERIQKQGSGAGESTVESVTREQETTTASPTGPDLRVPSDIRKAKMQQVMGLLSRETALVEAVSARLERLQV